MMTANIGTTLHARPAAETQRITEAYRACVRIANSHYENFSVGSWLLPMEIRRHIAAIYAFSRVADDIADEQLRRFVIVVEMQHVAFFVTQLGTRDLQPTLRASDALELVASSLG